MICRTRFIEGSNKDQPDLLSLASELKSYIKTNIWAQASGCTLNIIIGARRAFEEVESSVFCVDSKPARFPEMTDLSPSDSVRKRFWREHRQQQYAVARGFLE